MRSAMSDVRCLDCNRFSFDRAGREWASKGVGCCEDHIKAMMFDPERQRDCGQFAMADQRVIAKRVEWMRQVKAELTEKERERTRACPWLSAV